MKQLFIERIKSYFKDDADEFIKKMDKHCAQGFFLNTKKANKDEIFKLIDFEYRKSNLTDDSYYHDDDNIGKTKAYELGMIYPQEIGASLTSHYLSDNKIKTVVDMCAAPGGKTINVLNRLNDDVLCISNDSNHSRSLILSSNLERMGLDNVIITNKSCDVLSDQLENFADLVILDAPCSGEGMIRKYPEIIDEYSLENIKHLSDIQSNLLDNAYRMLKSGGTLIYSTCTYAFEEDEDQINSFLNRYPDMHLIKLPKIGHSTIDGCIKTSILNDTEGQFIAYLSKDTNDTNIKINYLKPVKEKIVDDFIKDNMDIDSYYLYKYNNHYYMSLYPLIDLKQNIVRYGIYVGDIVKNRFEPSHCLYRSNSLKDKFRYRYDLSDNEYDKYISGQEIKADLDNHYYLITYHNYSLGYGKCSNKVIKNKYPKGLRRMI